MKSDKHYKTIFKATSLFGVVEVIRMILRMVTNMGASYFLGPNGFGLVGLIENTTQLITSFTNFGINFTGIREIAAIKDRNSPEFHKAIKVVNLFCLATGCLAGLLSIIAASYLSFSTFETSDYYLWFVILSAYFVFMSGAQSKIIFLEGTQNFSKLIRINILINISNTVVILIVYYYFGINGIITAMVLNSLISFLLFLCFYLIRLYFNGQDSVYLSFYHAGTIVLVSYLGMIFIAMGKFFFPKLTSTIEGKGDYNLLINHQLEICLLIILPAILIVYSFGEFLISLLFSSEFKPVFQILIFGLAAIVFKGFNYSTGYLFLSNKNWKQYFIINALSDVFNVILTIWLFKEMQLYGIGLALLVNYILCAGYSYFYIRKKYSFELSFINRNILIISVLILATVIGFHYILDGKYFVFIAVLFTIISLIYSIYKLDEYILEQRIIKKIKSIF